VGAFGRDPCPRGAQLRNLQLVLVLLVLSVATQIQLAHAQNPTAQITFDQTITTYNQQILQWDRNADWQVALIVSVIALGAITAAVQGLKAEKVKAITAVLGIASSIITGINANLFTTSYKSLREASTKGRAVVGEMESIVSIINGTHPQGEQLTALAGQFALKAQQFSNLSGPLTGGNSASADNRSMLHLPTAYAQSASAVPAWATQLPAGPNLIYYWGAASDPQLANAQKASLSDALSKAISDISAKTPGGSVDTITTLVDNSYAVQDTYLNYDKGSGAYTYYTLVRLSTVVLSISKPTRQTYRQAGWTPVDLTSQGAMVIALDASRGVSSIYSDAQGPHISPLFKVPEGLQAGAVTADSSSIYVSTNSQLGCTVIRYSMSSHAIDQWLIASRKRCVGIASDGSTVYVTLPDDRAILKAGGWKVQSSTWDTSNVSSLGSLIYDRLGGRLIAASEDGNAYAISQSNGSASLLTRNLGFVQSLASSSQYFMAASGKVVLFRKRADNSGINPPAGVSPFPGGVLVGVTVDLADKLWVADYTNKLIEGPYSLN
jgi:hypothetical protein